jgi:hypothetical protein
VHLVNFSWYTCILQQSSTKLYYGEEKIGGLMCVAGLCGEIYFDREKPKIEILLRLSL